MAPRNMSFPPGSYLSLPQLPRLKICETLTNTTLKIMTALRPFFKEVRFVSVRFVFFFLFCPLLVSLAWSAVDYTRALLEISAPTAPGLPSFETRFSNDALFYFQYVHVI